MNSELHIFVKQALGAGKSKKEIQSVLKKAGWQKEEINEELSKYYDAKFPIPIPKREPYLSAKEAFLLLLVFTTLYISAINFGILLFQFINHALPDILQIGQSYSEHAVRISVASLIIAFPVFIFVSWLKNKSFKNTTEKYQSKINKWLTYITLFITAVIMIVDMITLVFNLLNGELTLRFLLKILTVLIISGAIFSYYLIALKKSEQGKYISSKKNSLAIMLTILISLFLASIIGGIILVGVPASRRVEQLDERRISDLRQISSGIDNYWNRYNKLPKNLNILTNQREYSSYSITDPISKNQYQYTIIDDDTFKLCAVFDQISSQKNKIQPQPYDKQNRFWQHKAGKTCFNIDVLKNNLEKPVFIR